MKDAAATFTLILIALAAIIRVGGLIYAARVARRSHFEVRP